MARMINDLLEFNQWANSRVLASLANSESHNHKALQLMAHLLTAEKIWLLRLNGKFTVGVDKSPELTTTDCERLASENRKAFAEVLDKFEARGLDTKLTYKNLSGKEFSTSVNDILTHVFFHGTYHRGQIALVLRAAGTDPADTDFITFVRQRSG